MSALTSRKTYTALAAFQAGDGAACAMRWSPVEQALDTLEVPQDIRWVLPATKFASVLGLVSVHRFPRLARLTTALLAVYFILAVSAHIRVRDKPYNTVPAVLFLVMYTVMTLKGPARK